VNNQNDAAVKAAEQSRDYIAVETGWNLSRSQTEHVATIIQSAVDTALAAERAENERLRGLLGECVPILESLIGYKP
jgi:hypothetical protein